jgi:hypothetical protein
VWREARLGVKKTNFYYLLVALLVFLVGFPIIDDYVSGSPPVVKALVFSAILIIGVGSLRGAGRAFPVGMFFVVAGVVLSVLASQTDSSLFQFGALITLTGFLLTAITHTIKQVAIGTDMSMNRIVGAVCVYLLLGVIWALAYSMLELAAPGSFGGFDTWGGRGWDSEWLYFSFVTMTTLGYGDLLPISATARAMAYLQAVFGQFYVAVLVAGLVSAYISHRQRDTSQD